jgi:spore coat polysaccharide biosynthesis protein SpsF (cytidylyltransferase family)
MIGAILQARMTSKRFPGKSMAMLSGKTVLERVIERAKLIPFVDKIIVAMPSDKASEPMGALCERMGVETFYGPEDDVLRRYYLAASCFELDTIVRITADSPFLDPVVAGEVLALLKAENLDYCSNVFPKRTYPKGFDVEAFTYDCLEAAHLMTKSAENREHVTSPWMQHRKGLRRANVRQKIDRSDINLCVDWPEDIERLENLVAKIKLPGLGLASQTKQLLEMTTDGKAPN